MIAGIAIFDLLLAATLVWIGWRLNSSADRFKAIVLYITFGVVLAVSWIRLRAPDLALVEAAIGAGLTGVLLLDTMGRMETHEQEPEQVEQMDVDQQDESSSDNGGER